MFPLFGQDPVLDIANDSGKRIAVAAVVTVVTSAASFVIGRYWGRYKASREWHRKEFLNRVIVSLNIFADGFLKIRTVMERSLEEVFLNQVAIDKVLAVAPNYGEVHRVAGEMVAQRALDDFLGRQASSKEIQHIGHANAHTADAWFTTTLPWFHRDAFEKVGIILVHVRTLPFSWRRGKGLVLA